MQSDPKRYCLPLLVIALGAVLWVARVPTTPMVMSVPGGPVVIRGFRPVGIDAGPDGSAYVADQGNGVVWRRRAGGEVERVADGERHGSEEGAIQRMRAFLAKPPPLIPMQRSICNLGGPAVFLTNGDGCVVDVRSRRVVKVDAASGTITTVMQRRFPR